VAATLNVQFIGAADPSLPSPEPIRAVLTQAFNEWIRHFDYTAGAYTINVVLGTAGFSQDATLTRDTYVQVGTSSTRFIDETAFGLGFAGRSGASPAVPALTLYVNPTYFSRNAASISNLVAPLERELEHGLGARSFRGVSLTQPIPQASRTVYDGSVQGNEQFFGVTPSQPLTFAGPNAQAVYGGAVPLSNTDGSLTLAGGGQAVNTLVQGAATVQPLDVALLRDAGLPALTNQELAEHQIARLYVAAFGRNADSAGLVQLYAGLRSGLTLQQLGDAFVASGEFSSRYGVLSDADFVNTLYQHALGRAPDASGAAFYQGALAQGVSRGTLVATFADSDEERGRLNGNPNVTYAATAEEQVARMYDAAFGRDADPVGFNTWTQAVINGASLRTLAMDFIGSSEFNSRYGAAPTDQALVDSFYQTTLHRAPDAAGEAQYLRALASGTFSRADLLAAFADSPEHVGILAQGTAAHDANGFNLDLTPHLGLIPVISAPVSA